MGLTINRWEAIDHINRCDGLTAVNTKNTHFANINASVDVWWLDIPIRKLAFEVHVNLVLYDHRTAELHHLRVPTAHFRANEKDLVLRAEKGTITLMLSVDRSRLFRDVRSKVDFKQFLKMTSVYPGNERKSGARVLDDRLGVSN